ncbi:MAG TPA: hypothetical protein VEG68_10725 [Terriglobales bacterium]|nr:hypothetical protein [Terriglobales bacterium]
MTKKTVCSMALVAALILCVQSALAQTYAGPPKPAIQDYGPFTNSTFKGSHNTTRHAPNGECGNPAGHCLFYGGDFVSYPLGPSTLPNGLANETTTLISGSPYGAAVWVPFTVPANQTWEVTGLFTNNFSSYGVLDQYPTAPTSAALWSINEGVGAGDPGTIIASGTAAATITATGRSDFSFDEYTVQVTGLSFVLTGGEYWLSVVPLCTNVDDPFCGGVFFLTDAEYLNTTPANAVGPAEPLDSSFFDSPFFGLTFDPSNGSVGACAGFGCDAFSAGVLGSHI